MPIPSSDLSILYYALLCMLIRDSLSVPTTAVRQPRSLTTKPLSLHSFTSSLDLNSPRNITSSLQEYDLVYRVPNTYVIPECIIFYWNQIIGPKTRFRCRNTPFSRSTLLLSATFCPEEELQLIPRPPLAI